MFDCSERNLLKVSSYEINSSSTVDLLKYYSVQKINIENNLLDDINSVSEKLTVDETTEIEKKFIIRLVNLHK